MEELSSSMTIAENLSFAITTVPIYQRNEIKIKEERTFRLAHNGKHYKKSSMSIIFPNFLLTSHKYVEP
jgi:hypothetical protein